MTPSVAHLLSVPSGTTESSPGRSPGSWISAQKTVPSGTTENAQDAVLLLLDPMYIEKPLHFFGKTIPPMTFLLSFELVTASQWAAFQKV